MAVRQGIPNRDGSSRRPIDPGELPAADRWLPINGEVSLLGGIDLLVTGVLVFSQAGDDLVLALLSGDLGEILRVIPIVGPIP